MGKNNQDPGSRINILNPEHSVCVFVLSSFHFVLFIQELILGQVDVLTQRDESPFMGKLPIVRKLLDYVEATW
jgi:hypothetical protein